MINKITFFFILFCGTMLSAQQESYIEIAVSDTVLIKPSQITYQIKSVPPPIEYEENTWWEEAIIDSLSVDSLSSPESKDQPYDFEAERKKQQIENEKEQNLQLESLKKYLKKNKLSYQVKNVQEEFLGIKGPEKVEVYEVKVKDVQALNKLKEEIESREGLKGKISNVEYPAVADYKPMYEKISKQAREEAQFLAGLNNASIGKLLQIKERGISAEDFDGVADKMGAGFLSKIIGKMMSELGGEENLDKKVSRILVFRFELIQ